MQFNVKIHSIIVQFSLADISLLKAFLFSLNMPKNILFREYHKKEELYDEK
jgi:hypothetical protein